MAFVVELKQGRTVGMVLLQVNIMDFGFIRCVSTLLANVHLLSAFFVRVLMFGAVDLQRVGFERTTLGE